ncbi:Glycosyl transferase [Macleaya cordata]|uniref:Glycosyl transferase n=1 Tax=Macleaya cordata TaxID=56857 RepID=A0A200PZA1_MACCD|nr:Glycosyl transferase [Macleaya cordata]
MAKPKLNLFFLSLIAISLLSLLLFLSHRSCSFSHFRDLKNPYPTPPKIAYFITGSDGDGPRILRLLQAVYHPRNQYLLHLDFHASQQQREDLAVSIQSTETFTVSENVNVVGNADSVNYRGPTSISLVLRGAAILLRYSKDWDWFVNLGAWDYPLITQDDFLHVLSFMPKDFNFIEHTSSIGWNEYQRMIQIVVDPSLYLASKGAMFMGDGKRTLPKAYKFFTGSPSMLLSRKLIEFSILGWENLPRTLLMYFANTRSSNRGYFQTLACNSKEFSDIIVNNNLWFIAWDNPPTTEPRNLRSSDLKKMLGSGAAFAGSFLPNDRVLDMIDQQVLHRKQGRVAPGGWCVGSHDRGRDPCKFRGDIDILRPGPAAKRFVKLLLRLNLYIRIQSSPKSHLHLYVCSVTKDTWINHNSKTTCSSKWVGAVGLCSPAWYARKICRMQITTAVVVVVCMDKQGYRYLN